MNTGDIVRPSEYALRSKRDYWQGLGDYTRKNAAKREYDAAASVRGVVASRDGHAVSVDINGRRVDSLDYMWELA